MARLNDDQRELILADYHTGHYTQRELAHRYDTSHVTIGKITKDKLPKHKDKVTKKVSLVKELSEASYQEVKAIDEVVDKQTRHLKLINDNATMLAGKITVMAQQIDTPSDLKTLVDANDRLAITLKVTDRHAPKIDVTQNQAVLPSVNYYAPEKDKDL